MKTGHEYLLDYFPNYDYHKLVPNIDPVRLDYRRADNIVGFQQRCFILYWCLKGAENGGIGVDMGCGSVVDPYCLGIDKYGRGEKDDYGGECKPHIVLRADKPLPFESGSFDFLVSNHSLEHMSDTEWTLREWIRIVKPRGILAIIMPDATYGSTGDEHHHAVSWTAEDFKKEVLDDLKDLVEIIEFNTLSNNFSMNCVLKKK